MLPMLPPTGSGPIVRFSAGDFPGPSRYVMWSEMLRRHIVSLETEFKGQFLGKPHLHNAVGMALPCLGVVTFNARQSTTRRTRRLLADGNDKSSTAYLSEIDNSGHRDPVRARDYGRSRERRRDAKLGAKFDLVPISSAAGPCAQFEARGAAASASRFRYRSRTSDPQATRCSPATVELHRWGNWGASTQLCRRCPPSGYPDLRSRRFDNGGNA